MTTHHEAPTLDEQISFMECGLNTATELRSQVADTNIRAIEQAEMFLEPEQLRMM